MFKGLWPINVWNVQKIGTNVIVTLLWAQNLLVIFSSFHQLHNTHTLPNTAFYLECTKGSDWYTLECTKNMWPKYLSLAAYLWVLVYSSLHLPNTHLLFWHCILVEMSRSEYSRYEGQWPRLRTRSSTAIRLVFSEASRNTLPGGCNVRITLLLSLWEGKWSSRLHTWLRYLKKIIMINKNGKYKIITHLRSRTTSSAPVAWVLTLAHNHTSPSTPNLFFIY